MPHNIASAIEVILYLQTCLLTYSHSWAVFANASIQNDIEVVVAGVEGPADDANDREDVQLQSNDGQLQKHKD